MREVVVAARDIAGRKPIEEGDLVMRSVVADATNDTAMTRIDEVLGRVSGVTIMTGQMLTQNMLASSTRARPTRSWSRARSSTRRARTCAR